MPHPLPFRARSLHALRSAARAAAGTALACAALAAPVAHAGLVVTGAVGAAAPTGKQYENFDGLALGNLTQDLGPFTVSFTGDAAAVKGNRAGRYAAPHISGDNGFVFGNQNGADHTTYLSTGIGTVAFQFEGLQRHFGLLWGSVDGYNSLEFYNGSNSLGIVTGGNVLASPNGNQGVNGTLYVNVASDLGFDRVVARSGGYAFEFDNVSYGNPVVPSTARASVPAPSAASFLGLGIIAAGVLTHRAMRKGRRLRGGAR